MDRLPAVRQWSRRTGTVFAAALAAVTLVYVGPASAAPSYVALGDSYSSGVGTRTYYDDGTSCQRSPAAYPVIDAARLSAELSFAACSGARTGDVLNNQLGALNGQTSYVTVSVGGNDAGFASVITQCAKPWPYTCTNEIAAANNYIQNTLPGQLDAVYSAIRGAATSAQVVVVGYPRLLNGEECNALARISPQEQAALNQTADLLATVTSGRAGAAGFAFVDARDAYVGHAVCDDAEWVNGLSNPISESYHPNSAGHAAYANLVGPALSGAGVLAEVA